MAISGKERFELREDFSKHLETCLGSSPKRKVDLWISLLKEGLYLQDNDITEQEARDAVEDLLPPGPLQLLSSRVRAAIAEYDRSEDHLRHGAGADCVRCRLEEALTGRH